MPRTIRTQDGYVLNNVPDGLDPNGPEILQRIAELRAQRGINAQPHPQTSGLGSSLPPGFVLDNQSNLIKGDQNVMAGQPRSGSKPNAAYSLPPGFVLDPIEVELPDGTIAEFPGDTPQSEMKRVLRERFPPEQENGIREIIRDLDEILMKVPGVPQLSELASGANRSIIGMIDFFGPDSVNELLRLGGSDKRMPTARQAANSVGVAPERGAFVGEGAQADILGAAGEVIPASVGIGAGMRSVANRLPRIGQQAESAIQGMIRQLGASPGTTAGIVSQDVGLGMVSGAGAAAGEELAGPPGQVIGAILAPISVSAGAAGIRNVLANRQSAKQLTQSLGNFSDEGAASILAEAMVREGIGPGDAARILDDLGPDAVPADLGASFNRLLRVAANQIPRIQGRANQVLNGRQAGQPARLASVLDDVAGVPGLSLDDELKRIEMVFKPMTDDLYARVRSQPMAMPERVQAILDKAPSAIQALKLAQRTLADRRAVGDKISHIDVIDAVKQRLDDQIGTAVRQGEGNRARDLLRIKNLIVSEADRAIPEYAQARQVFAGRRTLENAAELGGQYLRMTPKDIRSAIETMGESEMRMFRLGAKQAILDQVDKVQTNSDAMKRIFGKYGDLEKMRLIIPDEQSFDAFRTAMRREAAFMVTKSALQANSTTVRQAIDSLTTQDAFEALSATTNPGSAVSYLARLFGNAAKERTNQAYQDSLEAAADLLLDKGLSPEMFANVLRSGDSGRIRTMLQSVMTKQGSAAPALRSSVSPIANENR